MFFPEFLEALCRAVDKASPMPPDEQPEDWPKEKRAAQPLINKLENVIGRLIKLITHPDYKILREKFPMPAKDLATGLYIINYDNPYYHPNTLCYNLILQEYYKEGEKNKDAT